MAEVRPPSRAPDYEEIMGLPEQEEESGGGGVGGRWSCRRCCCLTLCVLGIVILVLVGIYAVYGLFFGPFHASCGVAYRFTDTCDVVHKRIVNQIDVFGLNASCGNGSNCYYSLVSDEANLIRATHLTSNRLYIDDLHFSFTENSTRDSPNCRAEGFSESRVWYAIRDMGTNYCNLFNLLRGADLHFTEQTRDLVCTQYSDRNCDVY